MVKRAHCVEGSWDRKSSKIGAHDDEIHVIKQRYSAFFRCDLDYTQGYAVAN